MRLARLVACHENCVRAATYARYRPATQKKGRAAGGTTALCDDSPVLWLPASASGDGRSRQHLFNSAGATAFPVYLPQERRGVGSLNGYQPHAPWAKVGGRG